MTMFGVAALLAPVIGPTLGGYLTDNYNWRYIFYINLPVGIAGAGGLLFPARRSSLSQGRARGAVEEAAEFRLHRFRPLGAHDVLVGDHAQQGTAVGLAG